MSIILHYVINLYLYFRFLITGSTYSNLSFSFRMGISTVSSIIQDTMKVIWSCLQPIHMPIPTEADFLKISKRFQEKWAFPHCLGAIDGRHIRIKKPANSGSLYYNYKKFHSIVLQAVIDADYKYVFIDVGSFGHMSDGGTFQNSSLCKALTANLLDIPKPSMLPNSTTVMPFFFISDGAYSLSDKFMKPYSRIDLSPKKKKFNKRLSRARVVVENGFGYTSQVFRIYYTTIDKPHHIVNLIVQSTCVLHNMLIDRGQKDIFVATSSSGVGIDDLIPISGTPGNNEINFTGKKVRDKLKDYLIQD